MTIGSREIPVRAYPTQIRNACGVICDDARVADPLPPVEAMHKVERLAVEETKSVLAATLADAFPQVSFEFELTTTGGTTWINISWIEGPTVSEVSPLTDAYAGTRYDSRERLRTAVINRLQGPDGGERLVRHGPDYISLYRRRKPRSGAA